ncbi:MAG: hypothetical protein U0V70_11455 [Terriglobia bacterium]
MKRKILFGLVWMVPSYCLGLFGCLFLLPLLSGNTHDVSVEAAMTGAFLFGPLAAIVGFFVAATIRKPAPRSPADPQ